MALPSPAVPHVIGRYALYGEIAAGGMATVHYGRLVGPVGFSRTVAIKRLHAQFAKDPEFSAMFLDEARLAARIRHPNVVQTLDVVALDGELFLVMDYVQGESLVRLVRACVAKAKNAPLDVVSGIICGALHGLHSAHEAKAESGEPLGIVHRDVSPQNVLVGSDGVPRVLDFGVAKAAGRVSTTREGQLKGKLAYMSPEQIRSEAVDRRTDVYAIGVVLWETLTLQRLFFGEGEGAIIQKVLQGEIKAPSSIAPYVPKSIDEVVLRALEQDPDKRFQTAREMALAIESVVPMASATRISDWVETLVGEVLALRAQSVAEIESQSGVGRTGPASVPGDNVETLVDPLRSSGRLPDAGGSSPGSQASSASLSTSALRPPPNKRPPWALILGAVVVLGVAAALSQANITIGAKSSPAGPSTASTTTPVATPTPTPTPTPSTSTQPPTAASTATATTSASAAPSASADGPKVPAPHPAAMGTPVKPTHPAPAASHPKAAASAGDESQCVIRSFVDESGIKRFVKECP